MHAKIDQFISGELDSNFSRGGHNVLTEEMAVISNQSTFEMIEDIYNNSVLLLHILSTSLQMSTFKPENITLQGSEFHMMELFETMTSVFHSLASDKGISLQSFFNFSTIPNFLFGDNTRVSQILMNLISNAVKYTNKGFVKVTCDNCSDEDLLTFGIEKEIIPEVICKPEGTTVTLDDICFIKIQCIDTGIGMDEHSVENLFNLDTKRLKKETGFDFYYSKSTPINERNQFMESHRLGLKISKTLLDKMKGKVAVSSEVGKGTTITLVVPFLKLQTTDSKDCFTRTNFEKDAKQLKVMCDSKVRCVSISTRNTCLRKY